MKKRVLSILSAITLIFMLGYLFAISLLLGLLASRFIAGKTTGEKGKIRSIIIPFGRWKIHLHHWLYSLWLIGISFVTGVHFLSPIITYGVLGGSTFQGIYAYGDWHVILVKQKQPKSKDYQQLVSRKQSVRSKRSTKVS
jgi:hypothetical protein